MFCRKPEVSEVFKRRLWWTSRMEACGIARAAVKSWRGHTDYPPEVATSAPTCGSASLECQKRCHNVIIWITLPPTVYSIGGVGG
jgi:hypothetical protein